MPKLLRDILAVIGTYIVMAIGITALLALAWMLLGADRAFAAPGVWETSTLWAGIMVVVGIAFALLGGILVAKLAARPKGATIALAAVIGVLSAITLAGVLLAPEPADPRPDDIAMLDAMSNARQPLWFALLNPVVGIAGIFIGANIIARSHKSES